jgi:hypothetical protein
MRKNICFGQYHSILLPSNQSRVTMTPTFELEHKDAT